MTWWQTGPTFALTLAVFFLPGLGILLAAGVRKFALLGLAAPISFTVASVAAIAFGILHVPFVPVSYFLTSAIIASIAFGVRRYWLTRMRGHSARPARSPRSVLRSLRSNSSATRFLIVAAAVIFPAVIITYRYAHGFGSPENFSQTFDNVYHLNAIRYIADTQNGSSLTIGNLTKTSAGFYPAAMHDLMALVFMMGTASVMQVVNVGTIVIGALIWPLSCIYLVARTVSSRPTALFAAGVFSASFSAFPYLMVAFGVLYPNHAAIALLPAALGLAAESLGLGSPDRRVRFAPIALLAAVAPGLALAHPSVMVALLGFGIVLVFAKLIHVLRHDSSKRLTDRTSLTWIGLAIAYVIVVAIVWLKVRPSLAAAPWTPFQSNARAIGEVISSAPMGATAAWVLLVLTVIGLFVTARRFREYWWLAGIFAVGGILYIVVSAWAPGTFRTLLTGVWYNDSFRLAALLPTVTLPVVVLGSEWLQFRFLAWIRRFRGKLLETKLVQYPGRITKVLARPLPNQAPALASVVIVLLLGIAAQGGTLSNVQQRLDTIFPTTDSSYLVTSNELTILKAAKAIVPPSEEIVGNPRTGASLVYAISNVNTLAPHIFGDRSADEQLLLDHWDEASYNPAVCPAVKRLHAYWALDFGDFEVVPGDEPFIGLRDLTDDSAPGVELVKSAGSARLFHLTACS